MSRSQILLYFIKRMTRTTRATRATSATHATHATRATHASHATHEPLPRTLSTSSRTLTTNALNLLTHPYHERSQPPHAINLLNLLYIHIHIYIYTYVYIIHTCIHTHLVNLDADPVLRGELQNKTKGRVGRGHAAMWCLCVLHLHVYTR